MANLLQEFKDFALKGNLLELAVAFVLGLAFAAVVASFVNDIVMNLIAAIFGQPDFSGLTFSVGDGTIFYGSFLTELVSFVIIAFALFAIVKAVNQLLPAKIVTRSCPHCLTAVPLEATACSACTRDLPKAAPA